MGVPGSSASVSAPDFASCFSSASATPPSSRITTTRAPGPRATPVGTHWSRAGRSTGTGSRLGIRSTASRSPRTVAGCTGTVRDVPAAATASAGTVESAGLGLPGPLQDPADHVRQRREVPQRQRVITLHPELLPHRREHLSLLDRVHPQIRLQIQVQVQQLRRITGQLRHDRHHRLGHLVRRRTRRSSPPPPAQEHAQPARRPRPAPAVRPATARSAPATQPITCVNVGKSRNDNVSSRSTPNCCRTAANTSACLTVSTPRSASRSRSRSNSSGG